MLAEADKKIRRLKDICAGHADETMLTPLEQLVLFGEVSGEIVDMKEPKPERSISTK